MSKCVNRHCNKNVITVGYTRSKYPKGTTINRTSYKTALCQSCRKKVANKEALYVTCTVCNESIFVKHMLGGVRLTCSPECAKQRMSMLSKERYRNANPIKTAACLTCGKQFTANRKYCSRLCYPNSRQKGSLWQKIERFEKLKKELKDMGYKV